MPNENIDPSLIDYTQPADTDSESNGASWIRQFKKVFTKWTRLEHDDGGKHFYNVSTNSINAYTVEIGNASQLLVVGLYAGIKVAFKANFTNTGASTLALTVDGASLSSAIAINLDNATLAAGAITSGRLIEVVYDGTVWQMVSGRPQTILPTTMILVSSGDDTTIQTLANNAAETDIASVSVGANSYTKILVELDVFIKNATGSKRDFSFWGKVAGARVKTFPVFTVTNVNGNNAMMARLSMIVAGGQVAPTLFGFSAQMEVASASMVISYTTPRITGVI